jgi:class 3 adenylate cyclase/tetratricopeptide (TPR) repeat protein
MRCPQCGHENAVEMKFCGECGTRLAVICGQCGARNAPAQKFCGECGARLGPGASSRQLPSPDAYTPKHLAEKILTSKTALEGERKQVTVLFADLKGSMELLADRDPEDARKLLDPVLEHMMDAVHRFEGTVNQVMGDGIMALFGAPLAHEDHALRACYAALRMQDAVKGYAVGVRRQEGITTRIRVGLNSGEVVVRAIGSDLHMDYTAVGQTTHLAGRMEQLADPGTILLTPATLALCEDFIQVKALGPNRVKGLSEPLEVYELAGANPVRSRFQAHAARGLTKFVGRASELTQLGEALELARRGRGQVVAVVGEPGVGKSRLFWEFTHSHRTHDCLVLEAPSVSYGKATPYAPVIDLLRGYFQIEPRDDARRMCERITGKLLALDRALEPALPALLALLDVATADEEWTRLDPPQRRQRTLDAVKRLLLREGQVQPLVAIFEDLHWIDGETQAMLDGLTDSLPTARLLLLVDYRPEYRHSWGGKTYYRQLRLDALAIGSAEELLDALLGTDASLAPLKRLLIERTEGNPFFLEESVRTLVEQEMLDGAPGAYRLIRTPAALQIPSTAQAIVAARIDRLASADKRLLQAASVIGKDVPLALLEAIGEMPESALRESLARLQTGEFLYETTLFPEAEYTFKHALTQEVTYSSLLHDRRRKLHVRLVDTIETLHHDRLGEHIDRLAYHAVRGELKEHALRYLRQAGLKAHERSALPEAIALFEQARGVLRTLPETQLSLEQAFEICLAAQAAQQHLGHGPQAVAHLREAGRLVEKLDDDRRRTRAYTFMVSGHLRLGELDEALAFGSRALAIARGLGDEELRIPATSALVQARYLQGQYRDAIELATDNLAIMAGDCDFEYAGVAPSSVWDRCWLASSFAQLGNFGAAAECQAEALRLAEPMHRAIPIGLAHHAGVVLHLLMGEWANGCALIERWMVLSRSGSPLLQYGYAVSSYAWVLAQLGKTKESEESLREGEQVLEASAAQGTVLHHGWGYESLGRASLLLGRVDDARRFGDRAIQCTPNYSGYAAHAFQLLGDVASHSDQFDAASSEAYYHRALAIAEPNGMRPLIAHCRIGLGKLHCRASNHAQAQEHLTIATAMYREMGMAYWLEQATTEVYQLG